MNDADLQKLLLDTFVGEAQDDLQKISDRLLDLETASRTDQQDIIEDIFRSAHSMKGAARAAEQTSIERIAHHLETVFDAIAKQTIQVTPELCDLALFTVDTLKDHVQNASSDGSLTVPEHLILQLERAAVGHIDPPASSSAETDVSGEIREHVGASSTLAPSEDSVRVPIVKLDALMAQVGELLSTRIESEGQLLSIGRLREQIESLDASVSALRASGANPHSHERIERIVEDSSTIRMDFERLHHDVEVSIRRLAQVTSGLQDDVRRTRMLPCSTIFTAFPRLVRDLSRSLNKPVHLDIEGRDTEVDRSVLEALRAPLNHVLRNCIDHGIEDPKTRAAAGKPEVGTVRLHAEQNGSRLILTVSDDGAGIDPHRIRQAAVQRGILTQENADALTDEEAIWLIFRSGFSTKQRVSDVSGRGVGMDVVREHVERLQGTMSVNSKPGEGSTFTLALPVSVATTLCLFVRAADHTYALPILNVQRIIRPSDAHIGTSVGQTTAIIDGKPTAVGSLTEALGTTQSSRNDNELLVILTSAERQVAMYVDDVISAQEVAVKTLPTPFEHVQNISGATIVGSGDIVPILNVSEIITAASERQVRITPNAAEVTLPPTTNATRILVVDDSLTIRSLQRSILESAGYAVLLACDGVEAWEILQREHVAMVISDVEMPRMNGIDLTKTVRRSTTHGDLPVILVTTLGSTADQQRGMEAGADAYLIKGVDQHTQVLNAVSRFIS